MKAAILRGSGQIEVVEMPVPEPGPGEVVIKVHYCGICGSDIDAYETGTYEPGLIIGHEFAGEIVSTGERVYGLDVGDLVAVNSIVPCGMCYFCRHGMGGQCEDVIQPGVSHNGGMAEYAKVPAPAVHRLPAGMTTRQAVLTEPLGNALHAVRLSALKPGDRALVMGAGPIGLLTLQCARLAGAREVYVTELSPSRARLAAQLGATMVLNPQKDNLFIALDEPTEGLGPDVIFVCAGVPAAIEDAITLVRKGGQIVVVGIAEEPVTADFMTVVLSEVSIKGSYGGYEEMPLALDFIAQGRVAVESLISHEIALEDVVEQGFEMLTHPPHEAVKVLVKLP
ncbi:MAG: galactitol-1-phosphate 5-dehydrogenase [Anaerolineae bacterium]|nr:galactitol-1-phosphate 5-dehydrogenase [Anaerolineae bacterium]